MSLIPFPHGLIKPKLENGYIGTIVTDDFKEDAVYSFKSYGGTQFFFSVEKVLETRKARGTWTSQHGSHPNFYKLKMKNEDNPSEDKIITLN